jgi:cytochrome P450
VPNDLTGPAAARHDLADPAFWTLPERDRLAAYARLRALAGPARFAGFSALVTHADVLDACRQPQLFLSAPGVTTPEPGRWSRRRGGSMLESDDPRHELLRTAVTAAYGPQLRARVEAETRRVAAALVDDVAAHRPTDFVAAVAAPLPLAVVCTLLGIGTDDRPAVQAYLDAGGADLGVPRGRLRQPAPGPRATAALHRVVAATAAARRTAPEPDLISALAATGAPDDDLTALVVLLLTIGVAPTRDAVAYGLGLLSAHPEERLLLLADPDAHAAGTVEEILRLATPIATLRRTLAREHLVGDRLLPRGDKVVLVLTSANRDERVFDEPDVFDVTRAPNPHLALGAGPHASLGAGLARLQLEVVLRELYGRLPNLRATGPAATSASSLHARVDALPFTFD